VLAYGVCNLLSAMVALPSLCCVCVCDCTNRRAFLLVIIGLDLFINQGAMLTVHGTLTLQIVPEVNSIN